ncbi:MAG: hypothetical protein KGL34_09640 [Gammaproteobacteria bacterium]|nr:hypothetical protein [Gammaproteobacteria bacterium]
MEQKPAWLGSGAILNQLMEIARISALAEMASGIAHELNQPLGAIATFAQAGERMLNRGDPMIPQATDVFRQINQQALGAGEGIRRIRRLFDHDRSNREACAMAEVIDELHPVLEMLAQKVAGKLQIDAPADLPRVLIDRLKIQHVLFALTQNGFDAAVEGDQTAPPWVRIEVRSDRYSVETSVIDSGSGIHDDVEEQLFRPFFTTKVRGTGLGLASSRAIVEAHEGTIGFDETPGGGSRFWFRLPVGSG